MQRLIVRIVRGILEAMANAGVALMGPIDWDFAERSKPLEPAAQDLDGHR